MFIPNDSLSLRIQLLAILCVYWTQNKTQTISIWKCLKSVASIRLVSSFIEKINRIF